MLTTVLAGAGDLAEAKGAGAAGLARARDAGDLWNQASLLPRIVELDLRAGRTGDAAMSMATAAEYALMLTDPGPPQPAARGPGTLSARERELVTLVARGRTDAQIAAQLYISIRTVRSHLDRIRDKTGCRRRADLTRLALTMGLV